MIFLPSCTLVYVENMSKIFCHYDVDSLLKFIWLRKMNKIPDDRVWKKKNRCQWLERPDDETEPFSSTMAARCSPEIVIF